MRILVFIPNVGVKNQIVIDVTQRIQKKTKLEIVCTKKNRDFRDQLIHHGFDLLIICHSSIKQHNSNELFDLLEKLNTPLVIFPIENLCPAAKNGMLDLQNSQDLKYARINRMRLIFTIKNILNYIKFKRVKEFSLIT